jgi:hypothetical protein
MRDVKEKEAKRNCCWASGKSCKTFFVTESSVRLDEPLSYFLESFLHDTDRIFKAHHGWRKTKEGGRQWRVFLGYANVDLTAQQNRNLVFVGSFELLKIFALLDLCPCDEMMSRKFIHWHPWPDTSFVIFGTSLRQNLMEILHILLTTCYSQWNLMKSLNWWWHFVLE